MKNGEICKYVYDFKYKWLPTHYEVIVEWEMDYCKDDDHFGACDIFGKCKHYSGLRESIWKISIKADNQYDPLFKGVSISAYFPEGIQPMLYQIGAELCKNISEKMGFEFSHAFVEDAKLKETEVKQCLQ